jgi:4-hydroxyacetophenone monooxygenase
VTPAADGRSAGTNQEENAVAHDRQAQAAGRDAVEDKAAMRAAMEAADVTCLRAAIYQLTGDPELRALKTDPNALAAMDRAAPPALERAEDHALVRRKAIEALERLRAGTLQVPPPPRPEAFGPLIELFLSEEVEPHLVRFWWEEFGVDPLPRRFDIANSRGADLADYNVVVIGGGMNGVTAAIALKAAGLPFTVLEQDSDLGGTWHRNRYPGARVDLVSMSYCYTHEPFYPWKHYYAEQSELIDYFRHCVAKHGVENHFRFNTRVTGLRWDADAKLWHVEATGPSGVQRLRARFVISAIGLFGRVNWPGIDGLESFQGRLMHSAEWDQGYDYSGKRVAVIGTGSSGVQLVAPVAAKAASLSIFQRTPAWIANVPTYQSTVAQTQRWLMDNVPYYRNWLRIAAVYGVGDVYSAALDVDPEWTEPGSVNASNHRLRTNLLGYLTSKIGHRPDLMEVCVPDYPPLSRRLPKDNGWYDAVLKDHVSLVTTPIERVTPAGIRTVDGVEHEFDLIVVATGFNATDFLLTIDVEGDGISLKDFWSKDGARAHLGMTIPHFPNLFCLYGPNTNGRAIGPSAWGEMQVRYALKCMNRLIETGRRAIDVREAPYEDYNRRLDDRLSRMLYGTGGQENSYFRNEHGRLATQGGFFNREYCDWTYEPDFLEFDLN